MKVAVSWSGGKDAAFALWELEQQDVDVVELFTTVSGETGRTSMHGVRPELMKRQADALGYPLRLVEIPPGGEYDGYEQRMAELTDDYAERVDAIAFADLFLEDIRAYREERLADTPLDAVFPLWGRDTDELFSAFLDAGFETVTVCVNDTLGPAFAGRRLDESFRTDLPDGVDPCGENGEFHTFVTDGPPFDHPVEVTAGERVTRTLDGQQFHYCDFS